MFVDIDELNGMKATLQLMAKLEEEEQSANENGWPTVDGAETILGL